MREFIGTFTAPGTGEVGVLGLELIRDHDTGLSKGVVRLEKRPYCEGVTRCVIDLPATNGREALRLTGVWIKCGEWDGEGCNVTVSAIRAQTIPATPTLDETTNPADVEWGEVRSAVAAKDWRRAWEVVGTDHEGDAAPGEAYIFGNARRLSCVSAALFHWRSERRSEINKRMMARIRHKQAKTPGPHGVAPLPEYEASWARIKRIAAWRSSAAEQYAKRAPRTMGVDMAYGHSFSVITPRTIDSPFIGYADTIVIDDLVESDPELYGTGRGVPGLFRNPWIDPSPSADELLRDLHARSVADTAGAITPGYRPTINGERQTYTVPASSASDMADALRALNAAAHGAGTAVARIASGNAAIRPNPAPHGPTRRRRR